MPTQALLTSGASTANVADYNPASITPGANRLIVAFVLSTRGSSTDPVEPTITGNGLTWVSMGSVVYQPAGTLRYRLTAFRALAASPSAAAPTISHSAAGTGCAWIIREWDGVDTSGTNGSGAVAQFEIEIDASGTSHTITLAVAPTAGNAMDAAFAADGAPTFSAEAGWTESPATELTYATPNTMLGGMYRETTDQSATGTFGTAATCGCALLEVKASGGTSETPTPGGGVGAGTGPVARSASPQGGADSAGTAPAPRAASPQGGATAQGTTATAKAAVTPGGAIAGGTAPSDGAAVEETPTPGGALAVGTGPLARVSSDVGGAIGAGTGPGAAAVHVIQGIDAGGNPITLVLAPLVPGGALAGGQLTDPLVEAVLAHFDQPSPSGGIDQGTPGDGHFDQPSPGAVLV